MVEKHGVFQGYYFFQYLGLDRDMRDHFRGHAHYERARLSAKNMTTRHSIRICNRCR